MILASVTNVIIAIISFVIAICGLYYNFILNQAPKNWKPTFRSHIRNIRARKIFDFVYSNDETIKNDFNVQNDEDAPKPEKNNYANSKNTSKQPSEQGSKKSEKDNKSQIDIEGNESKNEQNE